MISQGLFTKKFTHQIGHGDCKCLKCNMYPKSISSYSLSLPGCSSCLVPSFLLCSKHPGNTVKTYSAIMFFFSCICVLARLCKILYNSSFCMRLLLPSERPEMHSCMEGSLTIYILGEFLKLQLCTPRHWCYTRVKVSKKFGSRRHTIKH